MRKENVPPKCPSLLICSDVFDLGWKPLWPSDLIVGCGNFVQCSLGLPILHQPPLTESPGLKHQLCVKVVSWLTGRARNHELHRSKALDVRSFYGGWSMSCMTGSKNVENMDVLPQHNATRLKIIRCVGLNLDY